MTTATARTNGSAERFRGSHRKPHHRKPPVLARAEATETGRVKWFDVERAFGFVISDTGPEAFLHVGVLRRYGLDEARVAATPGLKLRFKTQPGVVNATPVVVAVFEEE